VDGGNHSAQGNRACTRARRLVVSTWVDRGEELPVALAEASVALELRSAERRQERPHKRLRLDSHVLVALYERGRSRRGLDLDIRRSLLSAPDLLVRVSNRGLGMTSDEDMASLAGQLVDLTRTVEHMARQITVLGERANSQQEATDIQQERIEMAARELATVSARLQAAADALREVI
jgi:hypothetical protein